MSCWNHPFEVARIEAQARADQGQSKLNMLRIMQVRITHRSLLASLRSMRFRGRRGNVSAWLTFLVCLVFCSDGGQGEWCQGALPRHRAQMGPGSVADSFYGHRPKACQRRARHGLTRTDQLAPRQLRHAILYSISSSPNNCVFHSTSSVSCNGASRSSINRDSF